MAFPGSTLPNPRNRAPLRHFLPTPKRMRASTGLHTPSKAHFPRGPRGPIRRARRTFRRASVWRTGPTFSTSPICRTERRPPTSFHTQSGKVSTARTSFDCPNVRFMQNRCHVRITGCSSFLTFHTGISCWRRKRRPLKSRSSASQKKPASKGSWFPPFENGSAAEAEFVPRRRLLKRKKPTSLEAGFSNSEWCPRRESNSHVFRQRFLRPPRLPFRHSGAKSNYTRCSRKRKPKFQSTRKKQRYRPKIVRTGTKAETRRLRFENAEAR